MAREKMGSPKGNRLLELLPDDAYQQLLPHLEPCLLKLGQVLHEEGKQQDYAYFPTTAIVALIYFTKNGDSNTVAMAGHDGLVGVALVLGGGSAPGQALVQTAGRAWRIRSDLLRKIMLSNASVMQQWLLYTQALMSQLAQLVVCHRHHLLEQQFCRWLLSCLDRLPSNRIEITQEMTASMLGVRRQGISEATARLEAEGVIARARGQLEIIDRMQLEHRVCECYLLVKQEQERLFSRFITAASSHGQPPGASTRRALRQPDPELLQEVLSIGNMGWSSGPPRAHPAQTYMDTNLCRLLGLPTEENASPPPPLTSLVHPQDLEPRQQALTLHWNGETPLYTSKFRMRHAQGHWIWIQENGKVTARNSDGHPLQMLCSYLDISAHVQAEQSFKAMARTDFLTGIASRMYFFESSEREFARSVRHSTPMALLALDLDHFKDINDLYGHSHGDRVLQSFVETVSTYLRSTDVFGRTGGEEFCVLLPDTDLQGAQILAKRIVKGVRQYPAMVGKQAVHYTVSVGVCERTVQHPHFEALMISADQQLYRAKALGRDRVETSNTASM